MFRLRRLKLRTPIIQAPMAGGISTPQLAAKVSQCGGLGSLAFGYLDVKSAQQQIDQTQALLKGQYPFAINIFIPDRTTILPTRDQVDRVNCLLLPICQQLNIRTLDPNVILAQKEPAEEDFVDLAIKNQIAVFSFTFGSLQRDLVNKLKQADILVFGTATHLDEAMALEETGVDGVIAQGIEAGGHRGGFMRPSNDSSENSTAELVKMFHAHLSKQCMIIAAGGLRTGKDINTMCSLGASLVQFGTNFIPCQESGASLAHRNAVLHAHEMDTCITDLITGKPVRTLKNAWTDSSLQLQEVLLPYPYQHYLTREIRQAAVKTGALNYAGFWSGKASQPPTESQVQILMDQLMQEYDQAIKPASKLKL